MAEEQGTDTHDMSPQERVDDAMRAFHERLQDAGLKSTRQRDTIVECFFRLDKHKIGRASCRERVCVGV